MKSRSLNWQLILPLILLGTFIAVNFGFYAPRNSFIDGDGNGYYAWLPAVFIYHTLDFEEFTNQSPARDEKYHQPHYFFRKGEVLVNKYTCGTALLQAPLFLTALGISAVSGLETNGYSLLFQYSTALSALIFLHLGLFFLRKLLQLYQLQHQVIIVAILAGLFATNLFFYAFIQPSFSHVYSFFAITLFAYFTRRALSGNQSRDLFVAAFALGLVVLIRPVNIIVVFTVPFLAGKPYPLLSEIKSIFTTETHKGIQGGAQRFKFPDVLKASGIFLLTISPQLIILILQTGSPFHWLYPGEGFYFGHPHIFDFLFSYKKGWFVYTPFMFLLIPGLIALFKRSKFEFISFLCFLLFAIYFFSAWWNWFYGDGFGMRPMVDYYGILLIPVGLFINRITRTGMIIVAGFILLAAALNLIQSYQYSRGILHADSMNKTAYWYTFMKTSAGYEKQIGSEREVIYGTRAETPIISAFNDFEKDYPDWIKLHEADTGRACSGDHLLKMDDSHVYSFGYPVVINDSLSGRDDLYVNFSVRYFEPKENSAKSAIFIADVLDSQYRSLYYRNFRLKSVPDRITGQWREAETGFRLPFLYEDAYQIRFYIWNKDQGSFYLDDMEIKIFTILPD